MTKVEKGKTIKVHYTGKLTDGSVFDSSEGRDPLQFEVGVGKMIPGFDKGVLGMGLDETRVLNIPAGEAYGETHEDLIFEVKKSNLPPDLNVEVGMDLMSQQPDGQQMVVKVKAINDESITIDANHLLAGKDLSFEVKVVEIA